MNDFTGVLRRLDFDPFSTWRPFHEYEGEIRAAAVRKIEGNFIDALDRLYSLRFYDGDRCVGEGELRHAGVRLFIGDAKIDGAEFVLTGKFEGEGAKRVIALTLSNPTLPVPEVHSDAAEP